MPQRRADDWPHGRTLGGSSSINGMVYIRGNPTGYNDWRDVYGSTPTAKPPERDRHALVRS